MLLWFADIDQLSCFDVRITLEHVTSRTRRQRRNQQYVIAFEDPAARSARGLRRRRPRLRAPNNRLPDDMWRPSMTNITSAPATKPKTGAIKNADAFCERSRTAGPIRAKTGVLASSRHADIVMMMPDKRSSAFAQLPDSVRRSGRSISQNAAPTMAPSGPPIARPGTAPNMGNTKAAPTTKPTTSAIQSSVSLYTRRAR